MNTSIYKYIATFVILSLVFIAADKPTYVAERTDVKVFTVKEWSTIEIVNTYGSLDFYTWDSNEVRFEVKILVKADREAKANNVLDHTSIVFRKDGDHIFSEPDKVSGKRVKWWKFWESSLDEYQVDYKVYIPAKSNLDIDHKHGNVSLDILEGNLDIELAYGNMEADDIGGAVEIDLKYGEGRLGSVRRLEGDISYSKMWVNAINEGVIDSKYAHIYIDRAETINCYTKYDNYRIGSVGQLLNEGAYDDIQVEEAGIIDVRTRYTSFDVGLCLESFDFITHYGNLSIRDVAESWQLGILENKYTDVNLKLHTNLNFKIEVNHTDLNLDDDFSVSEQNVENSRMALIGHSPVEKRRLKVKASYGSINIEARK